MSEEKFDYLKQAKIKVEEAKNQFPNDISDDEKSYISDKIYENYILSAEALQNDDKNYNTEQILLISQLVIEWTYLKCIDIIHSKISSDLWDCIISNVCFVVFEIARQMTDKKCDEDNIIKVVENKVDKHFREFIFDLYKQELISADCVIETMQQSHIDYLRSVDKLEDCLAPDFISQNVVENEMNEDNSDFVETVDLKQDKYFNQKYEEFTKFISDNPQNAYGYFSRGYLQYYNNVDNNIVLSDFDKAVDLNPDYLEAHKYRAYILEGLGDYEKLKAAHEKIIELEPSFENYDYYIRFLNTYYENGSKIALEVCKAVFDIFPISDLIYQLRGATYYYLKEYDKAIEDYKKAIELNPDEDIWLQILKQIEQEKIQSINIK